MQVCFDRRSGLPKGYGITHFCSAEEAQHAIEQRNDTYVDERRIIVTQFTPQRFANQQVPVIGADGVLPPSRAVLWWLPASITSQCALPSRGPICKPGAIHCCL